MDGKKHEKKSLKLALIIITILLISFISVGIYLKMSEEKSNTEKNLELLVGSGERGNDITYNEVKGYCRIIGNNSNLLYKNEYESDISHSEKVIFLDENTKDNMVASHLDVNDVLYIGDFKGEFIRVKYGSDTFDSEMSLAFIEEEKFYKCTVNDIVKKAFDKDGNEVDIPRIDYSNSESYKDKLSIISKLYALFDITNNDGEEYIVGMYDEIFSDSNPNVLVITVVLKKENVKIDITDEEQVKSFWNKYASYEIEENIENNQDNYEKVDINGKTYYHRLTENTWSGEYHKDSYYTSKVNSKEEVVSYNDYIKYIKKINSNAREKIENYYTDKNSNYIILSYANGSSWCDMVLIDCIEENNQIIIYGVENVEGVMASGSGYFIAIPTKMPVGTNIQYRECYSTSEISNFENYGASQVSLPRADKPIIYIYPTEDTEVSIKLLKDENLTCSYPKYQDEWNVLAKPNGDLKDLTTNRQLYSLYYESECAIDFRIKNEGFVVKGEDTIRFLEEKLAILGLTEREAEEFIIYWLPKLEANKYNYIRFATVDEINENMPLKITPNPDTIVRVLMTFKGLDNPIDVKKQELTTPDRSGFVVAEWGGTEIK